MDDLQVEVSPVDVRRVLAAFDQLPRSANDELRHGSLRLASLLARSIAAAGAASDGQSAAAAKTVRPVLDRVPSVQAGGTQAVTSRGTPAFKILFGSEFGARTLPQFRPHLGRGSYWFFRTADDEQPLITATWVDVVRRIVRRF